LSNYYFIGKLSCERLVEVITCKIEGMTTVVNFFSPFSFPNLKKWSIPLAQKPSSLSTTLKFVFSTKTTTDSSQAKSTLQS
jgi:hypothetical protein